MHSSGDYIGSEVEWRREPQVIQETESLPCVSSSGGEAGSGQTACDTAAWPAAASFTG